MGITGQKGLWAVNSRINQLEKSEGNIMHDDLTATDERFEYLNANDMSFIGTGVDPDEKRVIQFIHNGGKYNVYFGHNDAQRYSFPDAHGTNDQILQLSVGDNTALQWADPPAGENLGTHDLTLTTERYLLFNDLALHFRNDGESEDALKLEGSEITIGGGETSWKPVGARAGIAGKCLTSIDVEDGTSWRYPWNVSGVQGTGNMAIGVGTFTGYGEGTGECNMVIGDGSGLAISDGDDNIIIGCASATLADGSDNIILGSNAAPALTSGIKNIVIGDAAGGVTATGQQNIIIGGDSRCGGNSDSRSIIIGMGDVGTAGSQLRFGSSLNTIGPVAADAVTITQSHTIEVWFNGVAYYLSLEEK